MNVMFVCFLFLGLWTLSAARWRRRHKRFDDSFESREYGYAPVGQLVNEVGFYDNGYPYADTYGYQPLRYANVVHNYQYRYNYNYNTAAYGYRYHYRQGRRR